MALTFNDWHPDMPQDSFFFDAELVELPASQIPTRPKPTPVTVEADQLHALVKAWLDSYDGEFVTGEQVWKGIGFDPLSCVGWHSSRLLEGLLAAGWQGCNPARKAGDPPMRFQRVPPLMPCPGFENAGCGRPVFGGGLCEACLRVESEDLWNEG